MIKSAFGNLLALLAANGVAAPSYKRQYKVSTRSRGYWKSLPHTNGPRHWHDRSDPAQGAALYAAQAKRERKASKLFNQAEWSADRNRAHYDQFDNLKDCLKPFFINRETV